jgi:hypothetical protein
MNAIKFLWAAYIAAGTIHVLYIATLIHRSQSLHRRKAEIGK